MTDELNEIEALSQYIVDILGKDKMDFSVDSVKYIEEVLNKELKDGKPIESSSDFAKNIGVICVGMSCYIAKVIIHNTKGTYLHLDPKDLNWSKNFEVKNDKGMKCWPSQKVQKRFRNGMEDNLYDYVNTLLKYFNGNQINNTNWFKKITNIFLQK